MTAFESLVRQHQAAVCATAFAVLRDRARSEEIAQDAFVLAWRQLQTLSTPPALPAWICGIARNLARNAARKHREAPMTEHVTEPATTATPLDVTLSREHADLANRALATLTEDDRELVILYYRCEESIASVASALAIGEATARKRLQRTRERLRSALAAVEATLRASRPGPAFTAACVAALAAAHGFEAAAATASSPATGRTLDTPDTTTSSTPTERTLDGAAATTSSSVKAVLGVALASVSLLVLALLVARVTESSSSASASSGGTRSAVTMQAPSETRDAGGRRSPTGIVARIAAPDRAALLARVQARRTSAPSDAIAPKVFDFADTNVTATAVQEPPPAGPLGKKTLRYAIAQMHPMLLACAAYETVQGRLALVMRLAGDETGTVVESVDIAEDTPLSANAELTECVRTTLETVELPAKEDVAPWDVYYPLAF